MVKKQSALPSINCPCDLAHIYRCCLVSHGFHFFTCWDSLWLFLQAEEWRGQWICHQTPARRERERETGWSIGGGGRWACFRDWFTHFEFQWDKPERWKEEFEFPMAISMAVIWYVIFYCLWRYEPLYFTLYLSHIKMQTYVMIVRYCTTNCNHSTTLSWSQLKVHALSVIMALVQHNATDI